MPRRRQPQRRYYDPGSAPRPRNHAKALEHAARATSRMDRDGAMTDKLLAAQAKRDRKAQKRLAHQERSCK